MRRAIVGLLMATTLVTPALAQWQGQPGGQYPGQPGSAQDRGEIRQDRREVGGDRRELSQDGREVAQDRREVNGDYRRGDSREAQRDRQDLRGDRRDFRGDRQDFRGDRRDLQNDRRDYQDDHRGPPSGGFGGPGSRYGDHRNDGRPGVGWNHNWRGDRRYDWQGYRAANRGFYHQPRYFAPKGYSYRRYAPGYRIAPFFYSQRYWISDPYAYRLPPAYGPYRWVRYYDDVLLIDVRTGLVADVINGFFW